jgi:hypothetical protein
MSVLRPALLLCCVFLAVLPAGAATTSSGPGGSQAKDVGWGLEPAKQKTGQFWREHWYDRTKEPGKLDVNSRFRINSPEVTLHERFGKRNEARGNALMLIHADEDLFQVAAAELYLEFWGGHPGTANKRVTVNGRSTHVFKPVGTEEGHCTYFYPSIPLGIPNLVRGWNAFQFAVDQGTTFWGHALIDQAALRFAVPSGHTDLKSVGLDTFSVAVAAVPRKAPAEGYELQLEGPADALARVASVEFEAWYEGYDENGDQRTRDWHGFTKNRIAEAHVATVSSAPFRAVWDTSMLPLQSSCAVRARVRFKEHPSLVYLTAAAAGLEIAARPGAQVFLAAPAELPTHFWSRAKRKKTCEITLDLDPGSIERAELYVVTWTGGAGTVKEYFTLNGRHFPVAEGHAHQIQFNRIAVDPANLRRGANTIELLSDTEHHGIEIIAPGPALMLRVRR